MVLKATGASSVERGERIQSLWNGYGEIRRYHLAGASVPAVIVKHVAPPSRQTHRASDRSHSRKLKSYGVELNWYNRYARRCSTLSRVPEALACREQNGQWVFVLEDLDSSGFAERRRVLNDGEVRAVLRWLAEFHATFVGEQPEGLWKVGTYWHLATRPDEMSAMGNRELRSAAARIDSQLSAVKCKTIVHGDAKLENFGFASTQPTEDQATVAAVDFQYVGGGCGMKDVAYFFDSIWDATACMQRADAALDYYFLQFRAALASRNCTVNGDAAEAEWRALYPLAWADFYRFLDGWAPGRYRVHAYAQRMLDITLAAL